MTDYTELKRLAESLIALNRANVMDWAATVEDARIGKTHTEYALAANPATVLALIAENERLTGCIVQRRAQAEQYDQALIKMAAERDQLRAAISTPESVFINMKSGRIARISLRSAIDLHGEVINGDDAQQIEIARLRAEVAGLRTGYEAYEQVNAEMKAEVEVLRKDADRAAYWKQRAKSAEGHLFSGDFRAAAMELHKYSRFESTPWPELTGSQHALISSAAGAVIATVNRLRDARRPKNRDETDAIIWCACGDGHAANSYGAGFMDANGGVCANCDAAMGNGGRGGQSTSKTSESAYPEGLKGGGQ